MNEDPADVPMQYVLYVVLGILLLFFVAGVWIFSLVHARK